MRACVRALNVVSRERMYITESVERRRERGYMCVYVNLKRNSPFGYPEPDRGDTYQQGVRWVSCVTCGTRSIDITPLCCFNTNNAPQHTGNNMLDVVLHVFRLDLGNDLMTPADC